MLLKQFRPTAKALPDLMQFAALVDSGVVRCKSGALLAGFFYKGPDLDSSTNSELNWRKERINNAIKQLGTGWVTWTEACRVPAPGYPKPEDSSFPDPVTRLIDNERRATFMDGGRFFETEYALVVQYMPPIRAQKQGSKIKPLSEMVYDEAGEAETDPDEKILTFFTKALGVLQDRLAQSVEIRRMGSYTHAEQVGSETIEHLRDELVNFLRYVVSGRELAVNIPPVPMYMDSYLFGEDFSAGAVPRIGQKYIAAVALEGFPGYSAPGILRLLDQLPLTYRWSTRFIYMDQIEASEALNRYRKKWQQKIRGWWSQVFKTGGGTINADAIHMTDQAGDAQTELASGNVAYGYYSSAVILMHEDRKYLSEIADYVRKEIERIGFGARIESINAVEAWLGTIPGHPYANVRRPLISTNNLADLMPMASVWPGLATCPAPADFYPPGSPPLFMAATGGSTPFRFNLHVGDLGHTVIFGPTGMGKSTLLGVIASQFPRYANAAGPASVMCFDKGGSMKPLAKAIGRHYSVGADHGGPSFCPLKHLDNATDIAWASQWVTDLFELQARKSPTPQQRQRVFEAMTNFATKAHGRSLSHFLAELADEEMRAALSFYTISGSMGHILDAEEHDDGLGNETFSVLEMDELLKYPPESAIPVLLYLFRRFELSLKGQPALLILDEAWVMLGHPIFRAKIREWLKELRKKNCAVVMATQSLSDANQSGIMDVLLESCPTKIYLPNPEADKSGTESNPGPADLYRRFGLNRKQIMLLKQARPKRDYYATSIHGNRMFDLALGPITLSFIGVSDKQSLRRVDELHADHGQQWPFIWLKERNVKHEHLVA